MELYKVSVLIWLQGPLILVMRRRANNTCGTTKRRQWPTATPSSTSCWPWPRSTWWWHWPTGTGKNSWSIGTGGGYFIINKHSVQVKSSLTWWRDKNYSKSCLNWHLCNPFPWIFMYSDTRFFYQCMSD